MNYINQNASMHLLLLLSSGEQVLHIARVLGVDSPLQTYLIRLLRFLPE